MSNGYQALYTGVLTDPNTRWRPMTRIDELGGAISAIDARLRAGDFERRIYAEGDSWFDKFTGALHGTNLLDAIRTPFKTAVVDVSEVGAKASEMVGGWKRKRNARIFDNFSFDVILLSAGGNDLKDFFAREFATHAQQSGSLSAAEIQKLSRPQRYAEYFEGVCSDIQQFVEMRNSARRVGSEVPILLNGYDFIQPRPAPAYWIPGLNFHSGPWLHPAMKAAGLSDAEMRSVADAVVVELNRHLQDLCGRNRNVHLIGLPGLLTPAAPGSTGESGDWLDEIHPNRQGFDKLARNCWDVKLGQLLGWQSGVNDLVAAATPTHGSTALPDLATVA